MQILITGGTGFIGSRLALRLLEEGHSVRVLAQANNEAESQNRSLLEREGAEMILASITDRSRVGEAVQGVEFVFHLAAAQHEANVPDQLFYDVNVGGTLNLLEACVEAGVQRFIHGSTIGVYGDGESHSLEKPITEGSPTAPSNIYGTTKLEGERLVLSYLDRLSVVVIRISEVYGPGDQRLAKLFRGIQKGFFFKIGPGQNLHHLIYIDDLLDGFWLAATQEQGIGETYVLSGPDPLTTDEMIETVAAGLNVVLPPARAPLALFNGAAVIMETLFKPTGIQPPLHRRRMDFFQKSFVLSSEKAATELGFRPQYRFEDGVAKTVAWYTEQGLLASPNGNHTHTEALPPLMGHTPLSSTRLSARMEQFDSFWEGPEDIEKGYETFGRFYRENYLPYLSKRRDSRILSISCGPGYFVNVLKEVGYSDVLGIDSEYKKVKYAVDRGLNCLVANAVEFLDGSRVAFDAIVCEQELNHLTKEEMVQFLQLCHSKLSVGGTLLVHGLNGANPLTGSDASAQNFDHFNTFTEYSFQQVLEYTGFERVRIFPLNLYVFYDNPLNYVGLAISAALSLFFRVGFMLYGKKNKNFTKKIGAVGVRGEDKN
ncbi:MAG: class I SAM-dependent methyltransferase [Chloroflexota bacterium]